MASSVRGAPSEAPSESVTVTLSAMGRKVAILSRGYRRKKRSFWEKLMHAFHSGEMELPPQVVSDGKNLLMDSEHAGDEPYMLASNLPNVAVVVDKDRVKSGIHAIDEFETDVIILDDGFQYLRLKPHINIVLVDSTSPHILHRYVVWPFLLFANTFRLSLRR